LLRAFIHDLLSLVSPPSYYLFCSMSLFRCDSPVDGSYINCLPEEILQQILHSCVSTPLTPLARPSWHTRRKLTSTIRNRSRAAALLVCKPWLRIATPLFYQSLVLLNEEQATLCSRTLLANPSLGDYVRSLVVMGVWVALGDVIKLCPGVESLDLTLDAPRTPVIMPQSEKDAMVLYYLTQYKPRFVTLCLSLIIPTWQHLVSSLPAITPRCKPQSTAMMSDRKPSILPFHFRLTRMQLIASQPQLHPPQILKSCAHSSRWFGALPS